MIVSMYYSESISLRLPGPLLEALDEQRGPTARSAYLRKIIEKGLAVDPGTYNPAVESTTTRNTAGDVLTGVTTPLPSQVAPVIPITQVVEPEVLVTNDPSTDPHVEKHYHRRGERLDPPRWEQGKAIYTYRCAQPGCPTTME